MHVDTTVGAVAELEVLYLDARLAPVQRSDARAGPHARIELQPEIIQLQLISDLVESERGVGGVGARVVLIDDDLGGPVGFAVGELRPDAVQIETRCPQCPRLRVYSHL